MMPLEPNFIFVTPEQMANIDTHHSISYFRTLAENDDKCVRCSTNSVWRYGEADLCFYCHTGLMDASEHYELRPEFSQLQLAGHQATANAICRQIAKLERELKSLCKRTGMPL